MAGSFSSSNVVVGASTLFLGPAGTARPAVGAGSYADTLNAIPEGATPFSAWTNVGYTQEGFEVSYEPDFADVEVDQVMDSVLTFKQAQRVSLNTTLAEATLVNLMLAWGQASSTFTSTASTAEITVEAGALGAEPVERGLIAVGVGPRGSNGRYDERIQHFYRVINVESTTVASRRSENAAIPVSFRALPADNGRYGTFTDRRRTW